MSERISFGAVLLFSGLWLLLVYAPVAHWVWGGGWLGAMGVLDFAGGLVVHATAGVSALVVAEMLGPRAGFPQRGPAAAQPGDDDDRRGACCGSAGSASTPAARWRPTAPPAWRCWSPTSRPPAAALTWMAIEWIKFGKPSLVGIVTGMIAGLATITPASGFVGPVGGLVLGLWRASSATAPCGS